MDLTHEEIEKIKECTPLISNRDFLPLLNVQQNSSADDIKKSYYAISRQWHPDRFFRKETGDYAPMLEQIFIGINQAFKTLSNIEEKNLFDKQYIATVNSSTEKESGGSAFARHRRSQKPHSQKAADRKKAQAKKSEILNKVKQGIDSKKRKATELFLSLEKTTFF